MTPAEAELLARADRAEKAEAEVARLREEVADYEELERDQRARAPTEEQLKTSNALLRAALGPLWNSLWGPDLERLGDAVDALIQQRDGLAAKLARAEAVVEAARGWRENGATVALLDALDAHDAGGGRS
jgi:hypothetical protein